MSRTFLALAVAMLLSACSDDGSGPELVRDVEILHGSSTPLEQSIRVGDTLQLRASLRNGSGGTLANRSATWSSSNLSVARVDTTGLVTGTGVGTALIVATADAAADTVRISVTSPPAVTSPLECPAGDAGLGLAVGEVRTFTASELDVLCLAGGADGAEFVYVPFYASSSSGALQVEVAAAGVGSAAGPPSPALRPSASLAPASGITGGPRMDQRFHAALRERERRELTPRIRGGSFAPSYSRSATAAVPQEGDRLRLNVNSQSGCSNPDYHTGRVVAVTQHAVIVADTANPANGFTDAEYREFGVAFDTLVYPVVTSYFGTPTDIDSNARAVVFYTRAVNELTDEGSTSYTGGFFYGRDLFPKTASDGFQGCSGSNFAEMFYMLVPDPDGEVNNNKRSKDFVARQTVGVLAHEFQHLINASRRLRVQKTDSWVEETWLNEGLSHIAEELVFYGSTPLAPRQDITIEMLRDAGAVTQFNLYQGSNLGRYIRYLQDPDDQSLMGLDDDADDVETRGATWSFLRYAADRRQADETTLWKSMVDTDLTGLSNLSQALGVNPIDWMQDWTVAVYADNAVSTDVRYQQQSWNFRSLIAALRTSSGQQVYPTFPLKTTSLAGRDGGNPVQLALRAGGAAYLRLGVAAGGTGAVRSTSAGAVPPQSLRISVLRTR